MNKKILFCISACFLIFMNACTSKNSENATNNQNSDSSTVLELKTEPKNEPEIDPLWDSLAGTWYYTNWIDSTVINRKIFDYNNRLPYYRYSISFVKGQSGDIYCFGYGEEGQNFLKKVGANAYLFELGDSLIVLNKRPEWVLNLKMKVEDKKTGKMKWTNNYFYRKSEKIMDCEKYFAKHIFAGTYTDLERNTKVIFNDDYSVSGIDSTKKFGISLGIWEYSDKMDILTLDTSSYHWIFSGDTLVLTEAFPFEDEGGPAGYNLGKLKYRLLRTK